MSLLRTVNINRMVRMCYVACHLAFRFIGLATLLCSGLALSSGNEIKTASACYSNYNNFMRLNCLAEEEIAVLRVIYGVKVREAKCVSPSNEKTYRRECCSPEHTDCQIAADVNTVSQICDGHPNCEVIARWSQTIEHCDQDKYAKNTHYMQTYYRCKESTSEFVDRTFTFRTTREPNKTSEISLTVTPSSSAIATTKSVESVSISSSSGATDGGKTLRIIGNQDYGRKDDDGVGMTNTVIGAIVGGSIGMLLTFVVFIFYWGRKRRLRIIRKPEPSVWDYLLSQTFTVRGSRGYDHFSSTRSSASSDGESVSPVARKNNVWLPNISPQDDNASDVVNNLDTDTTHRLEIHQSASPQPYAFLSLGIPQAQLARHHDA